MEDNESQPTNVLDMIATDASPAEMALKPYAAASVFGGEPPEDPAEEPAAELETEVDQEPEEENA